MAPATCALPLSCLMLLLLWKALGAGAQQSFQLQQPQDKVSLIAGQTLNLTCTVSEIGPVGPIKWLKGLGSGNKTVYDNRGTSSNVMRVKDGSNTDFSIRIENVQPEDTGTYYCVKFSRSVNGLEVFRHGSGTEVSVHVFFAAQPTSLDATDNGAKLLSSPILWLGILLEKGLLGGLLIFLFKRLRK